MAANIWEILSALGQTQAPMKRKPQMALTPPAMDDETIDLASLQQRPNKAGGFFEKLIAESQPTTQQSDALDSQPMERSGATKSESPYPENLSQLYGGVPKEGGFWASKGGQVLQGIIPLLAGSGIGAALGALASPSGYKGLGAGKGAALGAKFGVETDIGQRQKSAEAGESLKKQQMKSEIVKAQMIPTSIREFMLATGTAQDDPSFKEKYIDWIKSLSGAKHVESASSSADKPTAFERTAQAIASAQGAQQGKAIVGEKAIPKWVLPESQRTEEKSQEELVNEAILSMAGRSKIGPRKTPFKDPDEVMDAVESGNLDPDQAEKILVRDFGF